MATVETGDLEIAEETPPTKPTEQKDGVKQLYICIYVTSCIYVLSLKKPSELRLG